MASANEKGHSLERAVEFIETAILQSFPEYRDKSFTIETRKIIVVDGVRHEIDVWVEIDFGRGYRSIFVFECKNWEEKVGKNEIILFSEKVKAAQAQRAFFVATSFTRDAVAQSEKDARIELVHAKSHNDQFALVPNNFHGVEVLEKIAKIMIYKRGVVNPTKITEIDPDAAICLLNGEPIDLNAYIREATDRWVDERLESFSSASRDPGIYSIDDLHQEIIYGSEGLTINNMNVERMVADVSISVRVTRPRILSYWDVERRGRALTLDLPIASGSVRAGFVWLSGDR